MIADNAAIFRRRDDFGFMVFLGFGLLAGDGDPVSIFMAEPEGCAIGEMGLKGVVTRCAITPARREKGGGVKQTN
jgi:hypothetical protein